MYLVELHFQFFTRRFLVYRLSAVHLVLLKGAISFPNNCEIIKMTTPLVHDKVWLDKNKYDEAERQYFEKLAKGSSNTPIKLSLAGEVAKARQHIKDSLKCMDGIAAMTTVTNGELLSRIDNIKQDSNDLWKVINSLSEKVASLETRVREFDNGKTSGKPTSTPVSKPKTVAPPKAEDEEDDGVDLFGSDSEEESAEAKKVKEERLAAYAAKKSKKPVLIAKSNIILDIKPWDDETDMKLMENAVRAVKCDGLLWGASKLVPLAYGIHKLQISSVVEDDKVSVDWLQETLEEIEDYVQSVDIAAFNKV